MVLTGFGIVASGILLYFFIDRSDQIGKFLMTFMGILRPFIFGACIAYLLRPICRALEENFRKDLPGKLKNSASSLAIVGSFALAAWIIYLFLIAVVPQMISSITKLMRQIQVFTSSGIIQDKIEIFFNDNPQIAEFLENAYNDGYDSLRKWVNDGILPSLKNLSGMLNEVGSGIFSVFGVMMDLLVGLIVSIYLLKDRARFAKQADLVLSSLVSPKNAKLIKEEVHFADKAFTGFLGGKIVDSAIIGLICYIFCLVARIPNPMLVSVIIGVTNIIPFFGPYIGAIPTFLLILVDSTSAALIFVVFLVILQQVDGNIIGPRILGNSTGLSSFWVLFAIMFFGGIWGLFGMIVGIPLFAVIYDIVKKFIKWRLVKFGKGQMLEDYMKEWHAEENPSPVTSDQTAADAKDCEDQSDTANDEKSDEL